MGKVTVKSGPHRLEVSTSLGPIVFFGPPAAFEGDKPMVVAIPGLTTQIQPLLDLPKALSPLSAVCVSRLPGDKVPTVGDGSLADMSKALSEAIALAFPGRPVVALGVSVGALVALGVRAPGVRRIVAVEPPLAPAKLWPLRERQAADTPEAALERRLLGLDEAAPPDLLHLVDGLDVPADVVVGQRPLEPRRELESLPSLVDEPERQRLAVNPRVRLHTASQAGHDVPLEGPRQFLRVLQEAFRRATAADPFNRPGLDEPLFEVAPLSARRVLHWGPGGEAFAAAYLARNPAAEVALAGPDGAAPGGEPFDVLALGAPPAEGLLDRLAPRLKEGGWFVARWVSRYAVPRPVLAELARHQLVLADPTEEGQTAIVRARKGRTAPPPAMVVLYNAYAALLMDVRTRLPAQLLRSEPALRVLYTGEGARLPPVPHEVPKIAVLQRPPLEDPEAWRGYMTAAISAGWVVVTEFDDHPRLIAEMQERPFSPGELQRLSYVHAVQTSTEPLVEAFRAFNPEVKLLPNAAFDILPFPQGERPRRVLYGATGRGPYPIEVARALAPAIAAFPDLEFEVIGDEAVFEALPTERKRFHGYTTYETYLAVMSRCAVSLSPVPRLPLRDTKSDAKFLDASRAGVLTIASPTIYERTVEHGVTGLLAEAPEDWAPLLIRALAEPAWARGIARNAWAYVREQRMFARQVPVWRDWYLDLWRRREALTESLAERLPGLREALAGEAA